MGFRGRETGRKGGAGSRVLRFVYGDWRNVFQVSQKQAGEASQVYRHRADKQALTGLVDDARCYTVVLFSFAEKIACCPTGFLSASLCASTTTPDAWR